MLRDAENIAALIISLAWVCVGTKSFINPTFRVALPSLNVLEDIFGLLGPSFAPGLFELLNAAAPATISWFRSLPPVPVSRQIWGVYAFVMEKQGDRPRLYVGSRTAETAGVRSRMLQHLDGISQVPARVARAKTEGFVLTHIGLLAWCDTPPRRQHPPRPCRHFGHGSRPHGRPWRHHSLQRGVLPVDFCPWSRDQLLWVGLCTHNCLLETLHGDLNLSAAQLEEMAAARAERYRSYHEQYRKVLLATPGNKERVAENNKKTLPGTIARQAAAKADKQHYCAPCDVNARDASELDRHLGTPRHAQTVARGGKALPWKCVPCGKQWPYKSDYNAHCKLKKHQAKVAQLAARLPPSWYGCHPWLHHTTFQLHDWPHKRVMTTRTFGAFDLRTMASLSIETLTSDPETLT